MNYNWNKDSYVSKLYFCRVSLCISSFLHSFFHPWSFIKINNKAIEYLLRHRLWFIAKKLKMLSSLANGLARWISESAAVTPWCTSGSTNRRAGSAADIPPHLCPNHTVSVPKYYNDMNQVLAKYKQKNRGYENSTILLVSFAYIKFINILYIQSL